MKKYQGEEKRKSERYTATNLRVILKNGSAYKGEKIKDVSLAGLFVTMNDPLPVGSDVSLTLDPKLGIGDVTLEGKVLWVENAEGRPDERGIGIQFTEMPKRIEEKLSKLFKTFRKV